MATKLHGLLNLSRIDKSLITKNQRGESVIWVDVIENRNGADQYGNTHALTIFSKESGTIYLGNLKPQEFGQKTEAPASAAPAPAEDADDLPFAGRPGYAGKLPPQSKRKTHSLTL